MDEKHWYSPCWNTSRSVIHEFPTDKRVLAWDLWNEPDNMNQGATATAAAEPKNEGRTGGALIAEGLQVRARRSAIGQPFDERIVARELVQPG